MRRDIVALLAASLLWPFNAAAQSTWDLAMDDSAQYANPPRPATVTGCAVCHKVHGGGGFLLDPTRGADAESLCLSCHGPGNPYSNPVKALHTKTGSAYGNYRITCRGCHSPHYSLYNGRDPNSNDPWYTAHPTWWLNKTLIGARLSLAGDIDGTTGQAVPPGLGVYVTPSSGTRQVIFGIRDTARNMTRTDWASTSLPYNGSCNNCHTKTAHHRNTDSQAALCPSKGCDHTHNVDKMCDNCHLHSNGFIK